MKTLIVKRFLPLLTASALLSGCGQENEVENSSDQVAVNDTAIQMTCTDLNGVTISASTLALPSDGVTITSAQLKPGTGDAVSDANFVPEFCMVNGTINSIDPSAPDINFGVAIPSDWNGKSIQIGGNGFNGFIPRLASFIRGAAGSPIGPAFPPSSPYPIALGYATFGSDSGHKNGAGDPPGTQPGTPEDGGMPPGDDLPPPASLGQGGSPEDAAQEQGRGEAPDAGGPPQGGGPPMMAFDWMANEESFENYSHAQIKKTHDTAFEIIRLLKGTTPEVSYFMGESQGGRDAMQAATLYGDDYDGVLASVPLVNFVGVLLSPSYRIKVQTSPGAWIPPSKISTITDEVLRQCDGLDGLEDGVISNYYRCDSMFDTSITDVNPFENVRCEDGADTGDNCLSDLQINTVNAFHSPMEWGTTLKNGLTSWPGEPAAMATVGPWINAGADPAQVAMPGMGEMIVGFLTGNTDFDIINQDISAEAEVLQAMSEALDSSGDISKLTDHGGKLLFHTGNGDYITNSRSHMAYYETVVEQTGEAVMAENSRFYVTPNAGHNSIGASALTGEPTPRYMDLTAVLIDWVENGAAPGDLEQSLMEAKAPYTVSKTRPLCQYPAYPHYSGSGDVNSASSYSCTSP